MPPWLVTHYASIKEQVPAQVDSEGRARDYSLPSRETPAASFHNKS